MIKNFSSLSIFSKEMKKYKLTDETIITMSLRITNNSFSNLEDHLRNNFLFNSLKINKPSNTNLILDKTFEDIKKNMIINFLSNKNKYKKIIRMISLPADSFLNINQFKMINKRNLNNKVFNKKLLVNYLDNFIAFLFVKNKNLINILPEFIASNHYANKQKKNFFKYGYLIIHNYFNPKIIEKLSKRLKIIEKKQIIKNSAYFYGNDNKFRRVYNLIGEDHFFARTILDDKYLISLLFLIFDRNTLHDKFFLSSIQSNTLFPGAENQIWHVDSNMPEPIPKWLTRVQMAVALDNFERNNGSTEISAFSHLLSKHPKNAKPKFVKKILCKKGSIIMWHGNTWHRSTANKSCKSRTAILCCFANSVLRQVSTEDNYLRIIDKKNINKFSENTKNLIGYNHGIL